MKIIYWLLVNKEWLFSGLGIIMFGFIGWIIKHIWHYYSNSQKKKNEHDKNIALESLKILSDDLERIIFEDLYTGRTYLPHLLTLNKFYSFHQKIQNSYLDDKLQNDIQSFLDKIYDALELQEVNCRETAIPNHFKLSEKAYSNGVLSKLQKLTVEADNLYKKYRLKLKNKSYI